MKSFVTWREYKKEHCTKTMTKSDIADIHKKYKQAYFKEYNKRRKAKKLTLNLSSKELVILSKAKENYPNHSISAFIKSCAIAYINQSYIIPDSKQQKAIIQTINAHGNLINQVVHKLHMTCLRINKRGLINTQLDSLSRLLDGYSNLSKQLKLMEAEVLKYTSSPPHKLLELSWEDIRYDNKKLIALIKYLTQQLKDLND